MKENKKLNLVTVAACSSLPESECKVTKDNSQISSIVASYASNHQFSKE